MCGRYVSPEQASIERAWKIDRTSSNPFPRRFNVQPTTDVPVLRLDGRALVLEAARWGLIPHWWKQDKPPTFTINARLEEAAEPEIAVGGGALAERPGVADESARVGQGPGGERARRRRGQGAHAVHTVHASQRQDAASTRA